MWGANRVSRLKLTVITPVNPARVDYLGEAAESVAATRESIGPTGWDLEWVVAFDGAAIESSRYGADVVVAISKHSGIASSRNIALGAATGDWVFPLDADDVLQPAGVAAAVRHAAKAAASIGWIATNRVFLDGARTAHWMPRAENWPAGRLSERWTAPFPFHPNSVLGRMSTARRIGGWPALPVNEDLAWALAMSEVSDGESITDVTLRYRVWPGQEVSGSGYVHDKQLAFNAIERSIGALRHSLGRAPISAPTPGGAHGAVHPRR